MKKYWKYSKEQLREVFSTTEQGLSEKQVQKIRETCGENILEEGKRPGLLKVFLSQFADLLIVILLIAALISMCSGNDCGMKCGRKRYSPNKKFCSGSLLSVVCYL